ncbi:MAG: HPr family phosphocarrier protein [Clostridia bacterium]|nr:HPr family phosphocarrier protein [Clostridia bacterium]MBQ9774270.1 HPr family phosphocarrier protein [Clostridia bacterium]
MKEFTYVIEDPNGMHARPAGKLATYTKQFSSQIRVFCGDKEADGKRLLSLMSLGAVCGATLRFTLDGEDEGEACAALERFCKEQWGDGKDV